MIINLKSKKGIIKQIPVGFSWTYFFFGFFVPLIRGDIPWFLILFMLSITTSFITLSYISVYPIFQFLFFIFQIYFSFIYNKIYTKELLKKGFQPADEITKNYLKLNYFFVINEDK